MADSTSSTVAEESLADDDGKASGKKVIKNAVDLQRLKLEKLMKNPDKPVMIPDKSKEKTARAPLEFIRNIWGSSAGAGSGDFHVYRGVRRREYARQKLISEKAAKEEADEAYMTKMEQNKKEADERTAKKRAKRLKKKEKLKRKKMMKSDDKKTSKQEESSSESDEEDNSTGADQS